MLSLKKPTEDEIRRFLSAQRDGAFSYREVGATRGNPPPGYQVDRHRIRLGEGAEAFRQATRAILNWRMFDVGWVTLCWPSAPIEAGSTVGVLIQYSGLWWLNASRIVYVMEEQGPIERYGFAYGTLVHAESGEERFTVEWNREDNSVWYDMLAFSRPLHFLARLGYPFTRALQKRFARDSMQAMVRHQLLIL